MRSEKEIRKELSKRYKQSQRNYWDERLVYVHDAILEILFDIRDELERGRINEQESP